MSKKNCRRYWLNLAIIFALGTASAGHAESTESKNFLEMNLEELLNIKITSATKTELPVSQSPGSVTVVTYPQIQESGVKTLPELLRLVAGVNVRWNPMMQTIDIRGFGESPFTSRVLLMIDDVPYNSWDKGGFPQQPGFDFFLLENIKQVEIIRGTGAPLYGENAFWGIINIVTLDGKDLNGGRLEVYGGGGDRETASGNLLYGQAIKDGSILVSAKYRQSQLPMAFWYEENDSKVNDRDLFIKGEYKNLELTYYLHDDAIDGFNEAIAEPGFPPGAAFASADKIEQTISIAALKYKYQLPNKKVTFSSDVAYMSRNGHHCGGCHALPEESHFGEKEPHGYQFIGDFRAEMQPLSSHRVLVGLEARKLDAGDHIDELADHDPVTGREAVFGYSKLGFYMQDQITLLKDRLNIFAGFRHDSKTDPELFDAHFSPRVAAVYNATDKLTLRAGWSESFHFPDLSMLYQNSWFINVKAGEIAFPLAAFQPNFDLQPETIRNFDFGLEYRPGPNTAIKADVFRATLEDFIVMSWHLAAPPAVPTVQYENHPDKASIMGGEFEVRHKFRDKLHGFVNYAYTEQKQDGDLLDTTGKKMEFVYAPQNKINAGFYAGPFAGVRANVELSWRDEYVAPQFWYLVRSGFTDPTIKPLDAYTYLNARLSYDVPLTIGRVKNPLRLNVYARNLLDEQPRETLIGVDTKVTGQEFYFGVEYRLEKIF